MERSLEVKIQYFADLMMSNIQEIESALVSLDLNRREEDEAVLKSRVYQEVLTAFEDLFEDIIFMGEDE